MRNTDTEIINNWRPEVRSLLARLIVAGCKLVWSSNGEDDKQSFNDDIEACVTNLTACDEGWLYVTTPTSAGKRRVLYLVLGNSPGELVSDYTVDPVLDKVTEAHYNEWENRPQPKATRGDIRAAEAGKRNWTRRPKFNRPDEKSEYELVSPGVIGRAFATDNAIEIDAGHHFNVSGEKAFGGAKKWPSIQVRLGFPEGEEARRDALVMRLQETIDSFFGRVS